MSNKYKSSYRCYLIDHHSPMPPVVPLNRLNPDEYRQFFKEAHIDSLMVYCKDHWGNTYYPSGVTGAQMHGGLSGDWISDMKNILVEDGIEFIAYYCIEYDEGAARRFPEWRVRKTDGSPLIRNDKFAKWSLCCYQTGYREYCIEQLKEIVAHYTPDALFLDIFGSSLCYCENCRAKFTSEFGYKLPETPEDILVHKTDLLAFLDGNASEFLDLVRDQLHAIDPTLAITINFACHYPSLVRSKLDYQFSEPLLKDNWFSAAYARDTAAGQYPILAPGEASQVYNYNPVNQYRFDLSCIAAQGCRVGMYSGSQHIDGTLDFEEARRLGTVYRELDQFHVWLTDRKPVKCIGIVQSDASAGVNLDQFNPDAILRAKLHNPHINAILGAMQLCENAKLPWKILPDTEITAAELTPYEMILLPEVYVISDSLRLALEEYVKNGGRLLCSVNSGRYASDANPLTNFSISKLLGVDFVNLHEEYRQNEWSAYLTPVEGTTFDGLLSCTTPPVSEFFAQVQANNAKPLLQFVLPCVQCSDSQWVNWWSPPPGDVSAMPALLQNQFGKGTACYCAFDFFTMAGTEQYNDLASLFSSLLRHSGVNPLVCNETSTPNMLRTAFFERKNELIIHQISMLPHLCHGETALINGGRISVDETRFPVKRARVVYPVEQELTVTHCEGRAKIELPPIEVQQIICMER